MSDKARFGFHEGEALLRLASHYPRVHDVIMEGVQNSIDKNASWIGVGINQKSRTITIRDNGDGVSLEEFERATTSIASSMKRHDKLGRFGLGLISPLGKCVRFTFTSTPRNDTRGYNEWTFVTEDLRNQRQIEGIPVRPRKELQFVRKETTSVRGITSVQWRTEVKIERYTTDRQINRLTMESLRDGILDLYGHAMRGKKIVVTLTITDEDGERKTTEVRAKEFEGTPLPEVVIENEDGGRTRVRLYLARKNVKKGRVLIGEERNSFRLDFSVFYRSIDSSFLSDEVVAALKSGLFEGEILNNRIHLQASRKGFEVSDALLGFCIALDSWYAETGSSHFEDAQETRREEKYQALGVRSMRVIEEMLKDPAFAELSKVIGQFKKGSIGPGHFERKGEQSPVKALAVTAPSDQEAARSDAGKQSPESEKTGHHPFTVAGPKGSNRVVVKSNSLGLQLMHEAIQGSDNLWNLDIETGTLRLNVLHPLWLQCEEHGDRTLMRLQEYLMLQALTLHAAPDDWSPFAKVVFDTMNAPYVYMLINADTLAGRQGGRPRKEKPSPAEAKSAQAR